MDDAELMRRLGGVFRAMGYEGATLSRLSESTGLQKASLYHRFPGGKEQMAREVLVDAGDWLEAKLLAPLRDARASPAARIANMVRGLDAFYSGGRQACLLNMLATTHPGTGPFAPSIKALMGAWVRALASALCDAGYPRAEARERAERALVRLQGSLVVSRGLGTTRPFRDFLKRLPDELLHA